MKRMGMVISLNDDKVTEYKKLHSAVWPEILATISDCNIRNYSIFLKEPDNLLFGYWEYHGNDFAADAKKMADDKKTQAWWKLCEPCQRPFESREDGEWWTMMEEVFHVE